MEPRPVPDLQLCDGIQGRDRSRAAPSLGDAGEDAGDRAGPTEQPQLEPRLLSCLGRGGGGMPTTVGARRDPEEGSWEARPGERLGGQGARALHAQSRCLAAHRLKAAPLHGPSRGGHGTARLSLAERTAEAQGCHAGQQHITPCPLAPPGRAVQAWRGLFPGTSRT